MSDIDKLFGSDSEDEGEFIYLLLLNRVELVEINFQLLPV